MVQIVNLETVAVTIDMEFYFAIPLHTHEAVSPAQVSNVKTERNYAYVAA